MWFFTSDQHYGHANVIKYSNRPFSNVREMNEIMIANHNSIVSDKDDVVYMGDFAFCPPDEAFEILKRLNGRKYWILGNHDSRKHIKVLAPEFEWVKNYFELKVNKQKIVLCHYPILSWNGMHRKESWMLHGHTHGSLQGLRLQRGNVNFDVYSSRILDVGVDVHDYFPIAFDEIQEIMENRRLNPIDHHSE